ncbi:butyrophilin subfamily 3 member A3-like [Pagrus major]|uniref:butyrophilin subfamily 3 member A3-like n=1 Tax=Pagrus major TaxID=143350 RepID=UPI003CC8D1E2
MCRSLFLPAVLLCLCAGEASRQSVSVKIRALAGETVVLPCHTNGGDLPLIEWSKEGLAPKNIVLLYREGRDIHAEKNLRFHYRTSLTMDGLKNGNISLRISGMLLSDAGKYTCRTIQNKVQKDVTIELVVDAVSEPKLSAVPAVGGGVTLQCQADCWSLQPQITFLDDLGNSISAEEPRTHPDTRGCVTVTRRMTLQTYTNSITCRVNQSKINQTRVTKIYIPDDCMSSCTRTAAIAVTVTVAIVIIFACVMWKTCGITVGGEKLLLSRQSSDQSTTSRNVDVYPQGEATTDLLRKIDELELDPHDKEDIVRKLTEQLNDLISHRSAVVYQHGQATINDSPPRSSPVAPQPVNLRSNIPHNDNPKPAASSGSRRPKSVSFHHNIDPSSPSLPTDTAAVSASSSSAFTSEGTSVKRTMSLPESQLRPKTATRPQRRYTMMPTCSNRFSLLENLSEDEQ